MIQTQSKNNLEVDERSFLENPSLGIYRASPDGVPLFVNKTFAKMLGFDSPENLMINYTSFNSLVKNFSFERINSLVNRRGNLKPLESEWITKNGRVIFLREHLHTVKSDLDQILFFNCFVEDVTEVKLIDELVKDIEVRDYSILKALPDFLFILSTEGIFIDYKINNYNELFVSPFELVGNSVTNIFPPVIARQILDHISLTLNSTDVQTFDFNLEFKNSIKYYEARIVQSFKREILLLLRDITAQKTAELQLKKITEELRQLNTTKDRFFSIIAHDLRTPIIGLIGYGEILANEVEELSHKEIKEFSSNIVELSKNTINLLSNLLEWSRLQTGRIQFNPTKLNLSQTIENVFDLLMSNAASKQLELQNNVNANLNVNADENMLRSIIMNLTSNSIKFTNPGGRIIISAEPNHKWVNLKIEDNGIGIEPENIKKIFDLDKNFSTRGTLNERGSGLGIILCKEFVQRHGGKIDVESKVNEGTKFQFTLPIHTPLELNNSVNKDSYG